jgi:hypothetical protein
MNDFYQHSAPENYPTAIEQAVGSLTLFFGQVDRLLIEYVIQAGGADRKELIGHVRSGKFTFATWINFFDKDKKHIKFFDCIDRIENINLIVAHVKKLKAIRDRIHHDSLLADQNNKLVWISNGDRTHDYHSDELTVALRDVENFRDDLDAWVNALGCSPVDNNALATTRIITN